MSGSSSLSDQLGKIVIVGGGKMGEAILAGMLSSGAVDVGSVVVANPGEEKRTRLSKVYGVRCVPDASEVEHPDTCILAVKPQVIRDVLSGLSDTPTFDPKRIISIAAGISTSTISEYFPNSHVVRGMPNTPLMVGKGTVGLSVGSDTPPEEGQLAKQLFECMGSAVVVDESLQDAVVAVSGSGPAYFALFVQALAKAGEDLGLPGNLSLELAQQTMIGTGALLEKTGQSPEQLIEAVSSPGGTTVAALEKMKSENVEKAIADGAFAAAKRSKELS
ncbi:MAG: pyrroline-5-carboxylate reductase [Coriobacteriales bacterium]|jgi:pyrroline-5-carboxylate reductase